MKKTALWVSLALTAFLLIIAGGIVTTVKSAQKASEAAAQPSVAGAATDAPTQTVDPSVEQAIQEREAAYQKMISDANARLVQAQKDEQALQAQLQALQQANAPAAATAPTPAADPQPAGITPQQAAQVAGAYIHRSDAYSVEAISASGVTEYKVTFSSGDVVYVSTAGQIISVQYAPRATVKNSTGSYSGEHENETEHDGN